MGPVGGEPVDLLQVPLQGVGRPLKVAPGVLDLQFFITAEEDGPGRDIKDQEEKDKEDAEDEEGFLEDIHFKLARFAR